MGCQKNIKKERTKIRHQHKHKEINLKDNSLESGNSNENNSLQFTKKELQNYVVKKTLKWALKKAKSLKTFSVAGYSNDDNPFGDSNLTESFVWKKKIEAQVLTQDLTKSLKQLKEMRPRDEIEEQINQMKRQKEQKAIENVQRKKKMELFARERARTKYQDWQKKEEEFVFEQSKLQSKIRLQEGRAKPIDVLSKNLNSCKDFDTKITKPYKILDNLTMKEMEELRKEIKMHQRFDRPTHIHIEFWDAMLVICDWKIAQSHNRDALDWTRLHGKTPPCNNLVDDQGLYGVHDEVDRELQGLTVTELHNYQQQIEVQINACLGQVLENQWMTILKHIYILKAKAQLKQIHCDLLQKHLNYIQHYVDGGQKQPLSGDRVSFNYQGKRPIYEWEETNAKLSLKHVPKTYTNFNEENDGNYSPKPIDTLGHEAVILDLNVDKVDLEKKRAKILHKRQYRLQKANSTKEDHVELTHLEHPLVMKVMGEMEDDDLVFGPRSQVIMDSRAYWWHDKYKPRKPTYFNKVHIGYEWNKYNQIHYNHNNPPPKSVQGYKFNIFYPNLVDKTKTPTYFVEMEQDESNNGKTCLLCFHAGPPYEDIAFWIVKSEWEYSYKKGFKCTFEHGVLHLYFNFKRYRYRR